MTADFADWLSPMLVKELRQGMRSRVFMWAFYLTQLLMILCVIFNLAAASADAEGNLMEFLNGLFWFMVSVPLLFVMPIRGFGALHGEMKARTLELVFLTRLSAWRIAAGKWTALVGQTLLLLCAMLPYVVLRYFLGGVNLVDDIQSVLFLFVASAGLTALTIALSPFESRLVRVLFVVGLIVLLQFLPWLIMLWMSFARLTGTAGTSPWEIYSCVAAYVPAFILLAMEIAASRIAPAAENHAVRKRLLGVYFLLVPVPLAWLGPDIRGLYGASLFFLFIVILDALAEPIQPVASLYRPFAKLRGLGGFLAALFIPGWPTATWYLLGLGMLGAVILFGLSAFMDAAPGLLAVVSYFGALIFPAALIRLFLPATKHFLGIYIILQFFFGALTLLIAIVAGISRSDFIEWTGLLPPCTFYFNLFGQIKSTETGEVLGLTGAVTLLSFLALLARSLAPWRDMRALFRQARPAMETRS